MTSSVISVADLTEIWNLNISETNADIRELKHARFWNADGNRKRHSTPC